MLSNHILVTDISYIGIYTQIQKCIYSAIFSQWTQELMFILWLLWYCDLYGALLMLWILPLPQPQFISIHGFDGLSRSVALCSVSSDTHWITSLTFFLTWFTLYISVMSELFTGYFLCTCGFKEKSWMNSKHQHWGRKEEKVSKWINFTGRCFKNECFNAV